MRTVMAASLERNDYPGRFDRTAYLMPQLSNIDYALQICNRWVGYQDEFMHTVIGGYYFIFLKLCVYLCYMSWFGDGDRHCASIYSINPMKCSLVAGNIGGIFKVTIFENIFIIDIGRRFSEILSD